jgi:transcriptional regulator with XRE-family HTH domain
MGMEYFGDKLRALRLEKKWTQARLASRLNLVSATISSYEKGLKYPSVDVVVKLCDIFDVSADYLLGTSESQQDFALSALSDEDALLIRQLISRLSKQKNIRQIE